MLNTSQRFRADRCLDGAGCARVQRAMESILVEACQWQLGSAVPVVEPSAVGDGTAKRVRTSALARKTDVNACCTRKQTKTVMHPAML